MSQRLGPWEILAPIAQGGQGAVLRGRDPATGAAVAVKVLLRQDPKNLRRFKQEAQVLERLSHPGIVRVLGSGHDAGVPWLAMALVEGQSLRARVEKGGPLDWREAASLTAALARAVAYAHEQGVIHRDLKPENVLLDAATGAPVLVDFGLLRRDAEVFGELSIDAHSRLSRTGELRGTPAYMAPEQASPQRFGPVTERTDVYGLGGVLCFLLTGEPPRVADSLPNLIYQLLDTDDPCDVSRKRSDVPPGLVREVKRATSRAPAARHASALELAGALERLLDPSAGPAPASRGRAPLVAAAGLLLLAGGVGAALLLRPRLDPAPRTAAATAPPVEVRSPPPGAAAVSTTAAPPRPAPGAIALEVFSPGPNEGTRGKEARALWLDDDRFVTWGENHELVRLWSASRAQALAEWRVGSGVEDVGLDGTTLRYITRQELGAIDLSRPGAPLPPRRAIASNVMLSLALAPDGRLLVGTSAGEVAVLASPDAAPQDLPERHRSPVRRALWSRDGRWAVTGSGRSLDDPGAGTTDNRLILREAKALARVADHSFAGQPVVFAFSADGRWLGVGTTGYQVLVVDLERPADEPLELRAEDGRKFGDWVQPRAHAASCRAMAFLPDGVLVSGSGDWTTEGGECSVRFWDLTRRAELRQRRVERTGVAMALLSLDARPDGRVLVGDANGKVFVIAPW